MDQVVASALKTSSEILKNQSKEIHG